MNMQTLDRNFLMKYKRKRGTFLSYPFSLQTFSSIKKKRFRGRIGADIPHLIPSFSLALPEHREWLLTILQSTSGHPPVRTEVFDPTTSGAVT